MVEGSTNSNLELDTAAPGAKLFRGPSGALFIAGGSVPGIQLLVTDSF